MFKFFVTIVFSCLEYVIVVLIVIFLGFLLAHSLNGVVSEMYYSSEQELLKAVIEGYESKQITSQQYSEILQAYREDQAKIRKPLTYILYAVSICLSTAVSVFAFKKYRSLRFRERFRAYFFPANY